MFGDLVERAPQILNKAMRVRELVVQRNRGQPQHIGLLVNKDSTQLA